MNVILSASFFFLFGNIFSEFIPSVMPTCINCFNSEILQMGRHKSIRTIQMANRWMSPKWLTYMTSINCIWQNVVHKRTMRIRVRWVKHLLVNFNAYKTKLETSHHCQANPESSPWRTNACILDEAALFERLFPRNSRTTRG